MNFQTIRDLKVDWHTRFFELRHAPKLKPFVAQIWKGWFFIHLANWSLLALSDFCQMRNWYSIKVSSIMEKLVLLTLYSKSSVIFLNDPWEVSSITLLTFATVLLCYRFNLSQSVEVQNTYRLILATELESFHGHTQQFFIENVIVHNVLWHLLPCLWLKLIN